jgi:hypothetical protein
VDVSLENSDVVDVSVVLVGVSVDTDVSTLLGVIVDVVAVSVDTDDEEKGTSDAVVVSVIHIISVVINAEMLLSQHYVVKEVE